MNHIQVFSLLQRIGISLNQERKGKHRWSTKPLNAATPVYRFASLRKVMDFWRARCQSTLYEIHVIDESVRLLGLHHPDMTEALFLALQQKRPHSYEDTLYKIRSNLIERPAANQWRRQITSEVDQLGYIYAEAELRRAAYFRALSRLGYYQDSNTQAHEVCCDESQDR